MLKSIKERIFPTIIALSALSVSSSAAFYSVSGLSKLFAGASTEVIIMAGSLEVAKLVIASLLYQYWNKLNKLLKIYLTIAATILILITSMGIYGFLSSAYQQTASKAGNVEIQIQLLETKKNNYKQQLGIYNTEKESINNNITSLRTGLANNVQTYKDKQGNILTSSSSANRKSFEQQLDQAIKRQTDINIKLDTLNNRIFSLDTQIAETKTSNNNSGELGPLKYLSNLTGVGMDRIINWLLLIIIFVFDPLAIALVIAANFSFTQLRKSINPTSNSDITRNYEIYNDKEKTKQNEKIITEIFGESKNFSNESKDDVSILEKPISSPPKPSFSFNPKSLAAWTKSKILKDQNIKKKDGDDLTITY